MKNLFKKGLVVVLPLLATLGVLYWFVSIMLNLLSLIGLESNLITVVFALIIIYVVIVTSGILLHGWIEKLILPIVNRMPVIKNIYNFFNDIVGVAVTDGRFDEVVLVRFAGQKILGFLTNREQGLVFVMTAPNVSSGFVLKVDEWEETDITPEEAMKTILSLGIYNAKDN